MTCVCLEDETHSLWDKLGIPDRKLVADFFIMFSRFEYAMKRSRYLGKHRQKRTNKDGKGWAKADWQGFARQNAMKFNPNAGSGLRNAVDYLIGHPPGVQVVDADGRLTYESRPLRGASELERVIDAIKRVRNNLFHGGKFPHGPVDDPARDGDLLRHSLRVLEIAVELDQGVKDAFTK